MQGRHFLNLDIGIEIDRLRAPIRSVLSGERELQTMQIDGVNRRGRPVELTISCMPLGSGDVRGVIVMMEPSDGTGKRQEG